MGRAKKIKINAKVQIIEPIGYMEGQYENQIGVVLKIEEPKALVQYPNGIKLSILIANLKVQ
jgi:hypothetical protein